MEKSRGHFTKPRDWMYEVSTFLHDDAVAYNSEVFQHVWKEKELVSFNIHIYSPDVSPLRHPSVYYLICPCIGAVYIVQPMVMLEYFGDGYIAEIMGSSMCVYGVSQFIGSPMAGLSTRKNLPFCVDFQFNFWKVL